MYLETDHQQHDPEILVDHVKVENSFGARRVLFPVT